MSERMQAVRDSLRTQLWPVPTIGVLAAIGLGFTLPLVDESVDEDLPPTVSAILFSGGPEAARSVLEAVSSSLITVTSLTFSLTVVTLQLASSQFSPRLLRTFIRDRFVHVVLALFLATFAFALTVLRTVRSGDDPSGSFVPKISVTVAFVLAIASVLGLVLFLAHLAREIRVETMLRNVHQDAKDTIDKVFPANAPPQPAEPQPTGDRFRIRSEHSGFLTAIDDQALLEAAQAAGAVVRIDSKPGSSLIAGVPFATAWPANADTLSEKDRAELGRRVNAAVQTGTERTAVQDVAFGFRQLVDVASRALSPSTNDPTTAIHAMAYLSSLLGYLADRNTGSRLLTDGDARDGGSTGSRTSGHQVRVAMSLPDLEELDIALSQPRLYGIKDPAVAGRILELLRELAWCDEQRRHRAAVAGQLEQTKNAIDPGAYSSPEYRRLMALYQDAVSVLAR